jgi:hypothetical protein
MPVFALWLRAALTVTFVLSGGVCMRRCIVGAGQTRPVDRVNDAAHVLMSVEMIAMVWSMAVPDPLGLQLVVFGVAAAWFALQATAVPLGRAALLPAYGPAAVMDTACQHGQAHRHGTPPRTQCAHHAVLLAAMVWMLVVSRPGAGSATMAAMPMPERNGLVATVVGGYCLLAAFGWSAFTWWPRRPWRSAAHVRVGTAMSQVGMTAAMGVMLMAMR